MNRTLFSDDIEILIDGKTLINKSHFVINEKTKYCVIGNNGCGKTTLINYLYNRIKEYEDILLLDQHIEIENKDISILEFILNANSKLYEIYNKSKELEEKEELSNIETNIYNKFRNKLKYLLSDYSNKDIREKIEKISNAKYILYYNQLEILINEIELLMKSQVKFISSEELNIFEKDIYVDDILIIPKLNLMNNLDNKKIYYSKIADELIRYNRIKMFMFEPKVFLSFSDIKYNLNEDEIILLQSLLTQEYFDDLIPRETNNYLSYNSYDTVEPNTSIPYSNDYIKVNDITENNKNKIKEAIGLQDKELKLTNLNCKYEIKDVWSKLLLKFRGGFKEINFGYESYNCSFDVGLTILNNFIPSETFSTKKIKEILVEEYEKLLIDNKKKIIDIVSYYGKVSDDKKIETGGNTMSELIMDTDYSLNEYLKKIKRNICH